MTRLTKTSLSVLIAILILGLVIFYVLNNQSEKIISSPKSPDLIEQNLDSEDESFSVLATQLDSDKNTYKLAFQLANNSNQDKDFYLIPVSEASQTKFQRIKGNLKGGRASWDYQADWDFNTDQHKQELIPALAQAYDDIDNNNYTGQPIKLTLDPQTTLTAQSEWKITNSKAQNTNAEPGALQPVYFLVHGSAGGVKDNLTILNVHSHPQAGENWEVSFTTRGTADLTITPADQATIDDDEFVSLSCLPAEASAEEGNNEERTPQILPGDVIYYPDWQCSGMSEIVHYTRKAGEHTLEFQFGDQVAYAYNADITWTERQPAGAADKNWYEVGSDADGSNLIAAIYGGRLYTSSDSGVGWTERQPAGAADKNWAAVASDSDGTNLIAGVYGGRLYTSSDSGANWTERQPAGAADKNWIAVASDADGSNLAAAGAPGRLYTSSDSGANWTERQPAGDADKQWDAVASDDDGSNLIVGVNSGRLYTSSDSGANWTERRPAGDADEVWLAAASDADGSNLIAADYGGRLYTSSDSGVGWTERQPAGAADKNWAAVASDADGSSLIAAIESGRLYTSDDSGANWTERQPAGAVDKDWQAVASDSDGSNLIAGVYGGRLYTGVEASNNAPTISSVTDSPDPSGTGNELNFSVDWNDADAEGIKMYICKAEDGGTSGCGGGGTWCSNSDDFDTTDPIACTYTVQSADTGTNNYYAYVCDDEPSCSAATSGTFTVNPASRFGLGDSTVSDPTSWLHSSGWLYRKKITIDNTNVDSDLTDFPLYVFVEGTGSGSSLGSKIQDAGQDLRFTSSNGKNFLPHEIESYSESGGNSTAHVWVKVPTVSSGSTTDIYMYYGNSGASDGQDAAGVWDDNYVGVWHLKETLTNVPRDETISDSAGTNNGTMVDADGDSDETTGKINSAIDFNGDADYVNASNPSSYNTAILALSAWVKMDGDGSTASVLFAIGDKDTNNDRNYITLGGFTGSLTNEGIGMARKSGGSLTNVNGVENIVASIFDSDWHHVALVFDTEYAYYLDGIKQTTASPTGSNNGDWGVLSNVDQAKIGEGVSSSPFQAFDGSIDEVRVSSDDRSADWIKFEYNNVNESDNELSWGSEAEPNTNFLRYKGGMTIK